MANYYSYRQRNRQLFENFVAQDIGIQQALRDGFPGVLPERDRYGWNIKKMDKHMWILSLLQIVIP